MRRRDSNLFIQLADIIEYDKVFPEFLPNVGLISP